MSLSRNVIAAAVIAAVAATATLAALADDKAVEKAIGYRQGAYKMIGWHFGAMAGMVKGEVDYDAATFATNAQQVATLSHFPLNGFTAGTSLEDVETKTGSKPDIWLDQADFEAKMTTFQEEAAKLAEVAQSGDMEQIKGQFAATGKSCKSCHDTYREKN